MNASKRKGTAFETAVVNFLRKWFPFVERRALRGNKDCWDITGIPGWMIECKAEKAIDLAGYMDEVEEQTANATAQYGIAVVKRRNRPVEDAYVVMTLATWVRLEGERA